MNLPKCFINFEGKIVIAVKQTSNTVYCIEVVELQHTVTSHRIIEFLKDFKEIQYDVCKCAEKFLARQQFSFTQQALLELKEVVMKTASIIAVNPAAEFIGKYSSVEAVAVTAPKDSIVISSALDFDQFTKNQLVECLTVKPTVNLKNVTKAQIAEQLYEEYQNKQIDTSTFVISDKVKKGGSGLIHKIHSTLSKGPLFINSFIEEHKTTEKVFSSLLSNLKNSKYSQGLIPIATERGTIDGQSVIILAGTEPANFERRSKMAKEKREKVERNGIRKQLRAFFVEGGSATKHELAEKFGVDVKIISDNVCYLKNPKFAGAEGPLNLITDKESKVVSLG